MKKYLLIALLILSIGCQLPTASQYSNLAETPVQNSLAIVKPTASPPITPTAKPIYCTVTAHILNLRQGPGTNHEIIARLKKAQKVKIINREGNWLKVQINKKQSGYIHKNYCH